MIKLDITTRDFEADTKIRDYLNDKIGGLDRYLPRQVRQVAHGQVVLESDANGREDNRLVCEVVLSVSGHQMVAREGAINMYAAIDIVVAKLRAQVRTYKEKQMPAGRRRLLNRLLRREVVTEPEASELSA